MRRYDLHINGKDVSISVLEFNVRRAELEIDGVRYTVDVKDIATAGETAPVRPVGSTPRVASASPAPAPPKAASSGLGVVTAPIPGQVLALLVKQGETVTAGQPLLKIEAMKMENTIIAPVAGLVGVINVAAGDAVTQGQELMVIG